MNKMSISQVCDALGNDTRYQIIKALKDKSIATCCDKIEFYESGISVGDMVKATGLAQSTISQHLKVLVNAGLVYSEKRGSWTCFFLNKQTIEDLVKGLYQDLI